MTREASMGTTDAGGAGARWVRRLVGINLGLVALQPLSGGFLMSGYARAVTVHAVVAQALQLGALIQASPQSSCGGGTEYPLRWPAPISACS